jgi:hypothetical protein
MNANELAYEWEHTAFISEESKQECGDKMATMLRQQQAEIESLRNNGYKTHYELLRLEFLQQQAEIERLIGAEPITYGMLTVCKNCGQQNPYFEKAKE